MRVFQIFIVIFFSSCFYDSGDSRLNTANQTNHEITVDWNTDTVPENPSVNHTGFYLINKISVNANLDQPEDNANWPRFFDKSLGKKLHLFIYNVDTLKRYNSIDFLKERRMYKRVDYSEEELEKLNWQVLVKD